MEWNLLDWNTTLPEVWDTVVEKVIWAVRAFFLNIKEPRFLLFGNCEILLAQTYILQPKYLYNKTFIIFLCGENFCLKICLDLINAIL